MTSTITTVYGASDDLIEVTGPCSEEFNPRDGEPYYLGFSNGVVVRVVYGDDGIWIVRAVACEDLVSIEFANVNNDGNRDDGSPWYSDRASFSGKVRWVVGGERLKATR